MGYRDWVKKIEDLEKLYYSPEGARFIQKADAPVLSTTPGVYNAVYGAQVWAQLNMEANAFGLLPKTVWDKSGWRVITSMGSSTVTGGVAENGAVPDTIKPTWQEISTKPKTMAHAFEVSEVHNFLRESGDDATGGLEDLRQWFAIEHKKHINMALLTNVSTPAGNNFESIDRVVSSYSEVTNCLDVGAGNADIYSLDRDASASFADAYVNHNNDTNRSLTDAIIRTTLINVSANGGNPVFWLTGWDTYSAIMGLYADQVRYNNPVKEMKAQIGVNGVQTQTGAEVGMRVTSLYGLPLFISNDVVDDGLSRIYLLDTSNPEGYSKPRLGFDVAKPTQYFEAGIDAAKPDPISRAKLGTEGMYRTMGELKCRFFKAQGKIRDLV